MKRTVIAVVLLLVVALGAQAQIKWGAGAQAGIDFSSFPKPASDYFGIGFGFGAHADAEFMKNFGARFVFDYRMFSSDKSKFGFTDPNGQPISSSDISGGNVSVISFGLEGLGKLPLQGSAVTPYGLFGFGLNISSNSQITVTYQGQEYKFGTSESKTNFGIDFGVGADFKIAKTVSMFGEFKFLLIFTEGSSTSIFPLTVGVTFWF